MDEPSKIPVTIVTGFLGAGKTTLLQRLVRECEGLRIAVIQNEVSEEMGIESAVLTDSTGAIIPDFFELPNGCICCTAKDDMIITLENIVNLGRERIDYIIVETTGIADPCMVAEIFWVDSELGSHIFLDGIVTVVDVLNFEKTVMAETHFLQHAQIGRRQVAIADRIIVNKSDLVTSPDLDRVVEILKSLNPVAEIESTKNANVSANFLLNIGSFDTAKLSFFPPLSPHHRSVDHVFIAFSNSIFDRHQLDLIVGEMLWEGSVGQIYRAKGLFRTECNGWFGLQAVGGLFETRRQPAAVAVAEDCKFLFVGSNLNKELISHMLADALVVS